MIYLGKDYKHTATGIIGRAMMVSEILAEDNSGVCTVVVIACYNFSGMLTVPASDCELIYVASEK